MAAVPKGFLRHTVLQLLKEQPMSGSEIMNRIEDQTRGRWKPSPGSIYPLLAWLQEKGYTREVPAPEQGIKRYTLTDHGTAFLEELAQRCGELKGRMGVFRPPFRRLGLAHRYPEKAEGLITAGEKLIASSWDLLDTLRERFSEDAVEKAADLLEQTAVKLDGKGGLGRASFKARTGIARVWRGRSSTCRTANSRASSSA
jgi:DNA-binding PadR family transcriptional regulator